MSYEDKELFILFDIRYCATRSEANAVWLSLTRCEEYRRYDEIMTILEYVKLEFTPQIVDLCKEKSSLAIELSRKAHEIVIQLGVE